MTSSSEKDFSQPSQGAGALGQSGHDDELGVSATWRIGSVSLGTLNAGTLSFRTTATDQMTKAAMGEIITAGLPSAADLIGLVQRAASLSASSSDTGEEATGRVRRLPGMVVIDGGWHQQEAALRKELSVLGIVLQVDGRA